jgi:hypothetical protein
VIASAFDTKEAFGVIIAAPPCEDDGWRAYIQRVTDMLALVPPGRRPVLIQILRDGVGLPSPRTRKALADLRRRVPGNAINAVVVESASVRMLQIALDWIYKPHYESKTHADFESAMRQLEASLGRSLPAMRVLYREAMKELKAR